jgi:hypothetical protein
MKKIRLNLDGIQIESYQTASISAETGTVEAHLVSIPGDTWCGYECYSFRATCTC